MATGFDSLRADVLANCLSFLGHSAALFRSFSSLSRQVCASLGDEFLWRSLCRSHWYATEERLASWPRLSAQCLYHALELWVPTEGFYTVASAFPWGLLVHIRILDGQVRGDVLRFFPVAGRCEEFRVPLFRVALSERENRSVDSVMEPCPWHEDCSGPVTVNGEIALLGIEELCMHPLIADDFFEYWGEHLTPAGLLHTRYALRLGRRPEETLSLEKGFFSCWGGPGPGGIRHPIPQMPDSAQEFERSNSKMLGELFGPGGAPCDLALVRSPHDMLPPGESSPGLAPGLYVGDYGHDFYGHFRTEVILLDYVTLTAAEVAAEAEDPRHLFRRPVRPQEEEEPEARPPEELAALAALSQDVTFVRLVKQCGDFHVPMGATTFVGVCGPEGAAEAMSSGAADAPRHVLNRSTRATELVQRSWPGFGTLAMVGFQMPAWDKAWLVQVADGIGGSGRFGIAWQKRGSQEVVVLDWIQAQDAGSFLQRTWLPHDLR